MEKLIFLNRFLLHNQPVSCDLRMPLASLLASHKTLKKAAVLVPLVKRRNGLNIILTERALHLRHHPGQVSFPGGKQEQFDQSLQHTALRETEEEIGILPEQVTVLGTLTNLATVSGFVISPYIGFVDSDHSLAIDAKEVRSVFEVPLEYLLNRKNFYREPLSANSKGHYIYCIPYQNRLIWGATAQLLFNLQAHVND